MVPGLFSRSPTLRSFVNTVPEVILLAFRFVIFASVMVAYAILAALISGTDCPDDVAERTEPRFPALSTPTTAAYQVCAVLVEVPPSVEGIENSPLGAGPAPMIPFGFVTPRVAGTGVVVER